MKTFNELCYQYVGPPGYGGDKVTLHTYAGIYETHLHPLRKACRNMVELGVQHGYGLQVFKHYLFKSVIWGIDKVDDYRFFDRQDPRMRLLLKHDATSVQTAELVPAPVDVVVDDASHTLHDQLASFQLFYPKLGPGGVYFIEDIQNLDRDREHFEALPGLVDIVDMRRVKGRYDDVVAIYRK